ncbi:MAG TPA: hypothetical protein VHT24_14150 [Pseudacidobacterium sp.]|nr:hypothetical protein [Pseudacidobacterium sp.]
MRKFLSLFSLAALFFSVTSQVFAQNTSPSNQTPTGSVFARNQKMEYFSLEHHTPEQMDPADAAILQKRNRDMAAEAEFYGYDMNSRAWTYEQVNCPMSPGHIVLRYSSQNPAGGTSLFTLLVPRSGGRVRIVPVLSNGATRFKPAAVDPRNFQLFSEVVPADLAKPNSGPDGKWLTLSACYAEMTGANFPIPKDPSSDVQMINAPPPTIRISITGKEREIRFAEPVSQKDFRLWRITYNDAGHIIAVSDGEHSFGPPIVLHPAEPPVKQIPQPPAKGPQTTPHQ